MSLKELAEKYNLKNEDSVRNINRGFTYFHEGRVYPIRESKFSIAKKRNQNVIQDLKNAELSIADIAKKNNISESYIYEINQGSKFHCENIEYPIRKTQERKKQNHRFSQQELELIKYDIKNTSLSWKQLSNKYGGNEKVFQHINQGQTYFSQEETYPLREEQRNFRKLPNDKIIKIKDLLKNTSMTQKEIAQLVNVSEPTIRKINKGIGNYFSKNEEYPLRP